VFDLPFGNLNVRNMIISHSLASAHWAFSKPCRLPAILFCTDVVIIIFSGMCSRRDRHLRRRPYRLR